MSSSSDGLSTNIVRQQSGDVSLYEWQSTYVRAHERYGHDGLCFAWLDSALCPLTASGETCVYSHTYPPDWSQLKILKHKLKENYVRKLLEDEPDNSGKDSGETDTDDSSEDAESDPSSGSGINNSSPINSQISPSRISGIHTTPSVLKHEIIKYVVGRKRRMRFSSEDDVSNKNKVSSNSRTRSTTVTSTFQNNPDVLNNNTQNDRLEDYDELVSPDTGQNFSNPEVQVVSTTVSSHYQLIVEKANESYQHKLHKEQNNLESSGNEYESDA